VSAAGPSPTSAQLLAERLAGLEANVERLAAIVDRVIILLANGAGLEPEAEQAPQRPALRIVRGGGS
jgi:hypothetical protein